MKWVENIKNIKTARFSFREMLKNLNLAIMSLYSTLLIAYAKKSGKCKFEHKLEVSSDKLAPKSPSSVAGKVTFSLI